MSEKIAKTICRFAEDRGHNYLHLENKGGNLVCACGHGQGADYLHLDEKTESSVIETFRRLVGAAENDLYNDKRFKIADKRSIISGRATLLPALEGEKLIITLSSEKPSVRRFGALGLSRPQQTVLKSMLKKKGGIIIIAAEDENGSTSTYYSLLQTAAAHRSAYSLENFPLQSLDNVNIINPKKYGSVENAVIKLLKTDSELIGVDATLSSADIKALWRAANTGRLIIATLPARNAAEALNILKKVGMSAPEIASQLLLINAQKLFTRPCSRCLQSVPSSPQLKQTILKRWTIATKFWPKKIYESRGCTVCRQKTTGSKTAVFEQMRFLPDGRLQAGYEPLISSALTKAGLGLISIEDLAIWALSNKKI
ncbi:MAG: ATPase, T2SS/T4P/T4SS family [bacterium]|nr:ATPase, T2SS/T4P/T4SS family [bacterium]